MSSYNTSRQPAPPKLDGCSTIDQYKISRKLGEGTFGQVHQGLYKPTQTAVALKEIIVHSQAEGIPITALREIKIMKALRHPNILHVIDMAVQRKSSQVEETDSFAKSSGNGHSKEGDSRGSRVLSTYYMVMAYMDHDLCGLLHNRDIRFTLPHIKLYMQQLLAGVGYLHEQQYMHRDIKSANVLVSNDGNLKVADFGLARKFAEAPPDAISATPAARRYTPKVVTRWYRPPELLLGEQYYTTAIDMWGVGCVFGEFFKRREILPGQSDMDQINQIFKLVGTPTDQTMPNFVQLPVARDLMPLAERQSTIRDVFSTVPEDALSLLKGMLTLDPLKRLTAKGALKQRFFTEGAAAAKYGDLPVFESSRELDVRRKRDAPSPLPPAPPIAKRQNTRRPLRAFNPKVPNKRELRPHEQIAPYKRNGGQYGGDSSFNGSKSHHHKHSAADRRRLSKSSDSQTRNEEATAVMNNGLDY